jgi:hypothetical protein
MPEEKSLYRTLENDIQNLENIMNSSPDDVTQASLVHKKLELGNKRQQKIEGILLRSRDGIHRKETEKQMDQYLSKRTYKNQQCIHQIQDFFHLFRSRANWHENGEKCSEYFCKLEKKNFIKKTITELIDENGLHITDPSEILLQMDQYLSKRTYKNQQCIHQIQDFFHLS